MFTIFDIKFFIEMLKSCFFFLLLFEYQLFSQNVVIDTLLNHQIGCRAISLDKNNVYFAGIKGKYGKINLQSKKISMQEMKFDSVKIEFRSIAQNKTDFFVLNVSNPALLYKINKETFNLKLVYTEKHLKVFYDAMIFINENEGFAVGDPLTNYPCLLFTNNAGEQWTKIEPKSIPVLEEGEAFFAASNSNIHYKNGTLFLVTGGKKSRVFVSKNKGMTWQVYNTPIVQGKTMTGAFCADFYSDKIGILAGGNYEKLNDGSNNLVYTSDGANTWKVIPNANVFGYVSSVVFNKNNPDKIALATTSGVFLGNLSTNSFKKIANYKDIYTIRFLDKNTLIAAGKDKIVRLKMDKYEF